MPVEPTLALLPETVSDRWMASSENKGVIAVIKGLCGYYRYILGSTGIMERKWKPPKKSGP